MAKSKVIIANIKKSVLPPSICQFQFGHGAMQPLQLPVGISTPPPRSASSSARHRRTPSAGSVTSAHRGATAAGGVAKDAVQVWGVLAFFWAKNLSWVAFFHCQLMSVAYTKTNMESRNTQLVGFVFL